jgi:hypothetical protein
MWENHLSGSEGGAAHDRPYPYPRHKINGPVPKRRGRGGQSQVIFRNAF